MLCALSLRAWASFNIVVLNRHLTELRAWGAYTKRATHLLTGTAIGAMASFLFDGGLELLLIGGAAGLLPDLDVLLVPLCRDAHRSAWSHSLGASVMFSVAWLLILHVALTVFGFEVVDGASVPASVAVVFLATFAHAAEDAMTRYGCRLLHPLSKRRLSGPFKYDDVAANAGLSMVSLATIALFLGTAL